MRVLERGGGVLPHALVQFRGRDETRVVTDGGGEAELTLPAGVMPVAPVVAAGTAGYRNAERALFADDPHVGWRPGHVAKGVITLELEPLALNDSPDYAFQHPDAHADPDDVMACATCHMSTYQAWVGSRHARMATNGHVAWHKARRMARGHDVQRCDGCHAPGRIADPDADHIMASNHCDLCHKIWRVQDVRADGALGAFAWLRPDPTDKLRPGSLHTMFGTRIDVSYAYMGAAYNPLFATSHLCGSCHQGGGHDGRLDVAPKINTFEEWRAWAAKEGPKSAHSCQDCHMPRGHDRNRDGSLVSQIAWDAMRRSPGALHDHSFLGVTPALGARALEGAIESTREGDRVRVGVTLQNVGAGHSVPTGTWTKHLVVGIWAQVRRRLASPIGRITGRARGSCRGRFCCVRDCGWSQTWRLEKSSRHGSGREASWSNGALQAAEHGQGVGTCAARRHTPGTRSCAHDRGGLRCLDVAARTACGQGAHRGPGGTSTRRDRCRSRAHALAGQCRRPAPAGVASGTVAMRGKSLRQVALALSLAATSCGDSAPSGLEALLGKKEIIDVPRVYMHRGTAHWMREARSAAPARRSLALWALADLSERPEGVDALAREGLLSEAGTVRLAALHLVAALGKPVRDERALQAILHAFSAQGAATRRAARRAAVAFEGESALRLVSLLDAKDPTLRWRAAAALAHVQTPSEEALARLDGTRQRDPVARVRRQAAWSLAWMGEAGPQRLAEALVRACNADANEAREELMGALRRGGAGVAPALGWLLDQGAACPEAADAAGSLLSARPAWAAMVVPALRRACALEGPAALDAELLLESLGEEVPKTK